MSKDEASSGLDHLVRNTIQVVDLTSSAGSISIEFHSLHRGRLVVCRFHFQGADDVTSMFPIYLVPKSFWESISANRTNVGRSVERCFHPDDSNDLLRLTVLRRVWILRVHLFKQESSIQSEQVNRSCSDRSWTKQPSRQWTDSHVHVTQEFRFGEHRSLDESSNDLDTESNLSTINGITGLSKNATKISRTFTGVCWISSNRRREDQSAVWTGQSDTINWLIIDSTSV